MSEEYLINGYIYDYPYIPGMTAVLVNGLVGDIMYCGENSNKLQVIGKSKVNSERHILTDPRLANPSVPPLCAGYDIAELYAPVTTNRYDFDDLTHRKLVWPPKKKMTLSEIEKELGYKIQIVPDIE